MTSNTQHEPGTTYEADPQPGDPTGFDVLVSREMQLVRVREEARRRLAEVEAERLFQPFMISSLAEIRARPPEPTHRLTGLIPARSNTIITAPRKVGKTTFVLNLVQALTTGDPFLGRFAVRPVSGVVALLNYELDEAQLAIWAETIGVPDDKLHIVSLRGKPNPFRSDYELDQLARELIKIGTEVVIPDPYARAFSGESENDTTQAVRWLDRLEEFARTAVGAEDVIMPVHSGWAGGQERSRGASALEGWADSIVNLLLADEKDVTSYRFMRAFGRDVDVTEDRLSYNATTKRLSMTGDGNRKQAVQEVRRRELSIAVLDALDDHPKCSLTELKESLRKLGANLGKSTDLSETVKRLINQGLVHNEIGTKRGWCLSRVRL